MSQYNDFLCMDQYLDIKQMNILPVLLNMFQTNLKNGTKILEIPQLGK